MTPNISSNHRHRDDALAIFRAALAAVSPEAAIRRHLDRSGNTLVAAGKRIDLNRVDRIIVVGAGKATAPMAKAIEELVGERIAEGLISVKYGHGVPLSRIVTIEAGHPVPDANGLEAGKRIMAMVAQAGPQDLIICLLSGGASALMPLPAAGLSLADKQAATQVLLACGATIHQINAIRKHLSAIKGGRLAAAAHPAPTLCLILSDVVGDDIQTIASGPTTADATTFADCLAIVKGFGVEDRMPPAVMDHLQNGAAGNVPETPGPDHPALATTANRLIGTNLLALEAARQKAVQLGYNTLILSSLVEGQAEEVAGFLAAIARQVPQGHPVGAPACILAGGETTVVVKGKGRGGRNQHLALAAAARIRGPAPVTLLSAGTDGTDGPTDAAGAMADNATIDRAVGLGLEPSTCLADNDAYRFFQALGDLVITGPTLTNVMDVQVMLVG